MRSRPAVAIIGNLVITLGLGLAAVTSWLYWSPVFYLVAISIFLVVIGSIILKSGEWRRD
jgi:uncharacterized membrane protein YccC